MAINLKILFILLFSASLVAAEEIRLTYKMGSLAEISTEVQSDLHIKIGDKEEMAARGTEKIKTEVKVISPQGISQGTPQGTVEQLPLALSYKLLGYSNEIQQGSESTVIDIDKPNTDYFYAEIKHLKGKEALIILKDVEKGFEPKESHDPLAEILHSKKVHDLILVRLREAFSLAGQSLSVGKVIEIPATYGDKTTQEATLSYKITQITDQVVEADLTFSLPRQRKEAKGILVSSGHLTGKAIYQRKNALNFDIELAGRFSSSLKPEDKTVQTQTLDIQFTVHGISKI